MVEGVPPQEASDRLIIFQNRFDTIWRKYITYSGKLENLFRIGFSDYFASRHSSIGQPMLEAKFDFRK